MIATLMFGVILLMVMAVAAMCYLMLLEQRNTQRALMRIHTAMVMSRPVPQLPDQDVHWLDIVNPAWAGYEERLAA